MNGMASSRGSCGRMLLDLCCACSHKGETQRHTSERCSPKSTFLYECMQEHHHVQLFSSSHMENLAWPVE